MFSLQALRNKRFTAVIASGFGLTICAGQNTVLQIQSTKAVTPLLQWLCWRAYHYLQNRWTPLQMLPSVDLAIIACSLLPRLQL